MGVYIFVKSAVKPSIDHTEDITTVMIRKATTTEQLHPWCQKTLIILLKETRSVTMNIFRKKIFLNHL